jgi:polysaccharide pyruvyl transferase CsaB
MVAEGQIMRIGVCGYYGFQNAGDEAILEAITQEVKIRGHQVLAFSSKPADTATRYGVESIDRMHLGQVWDALGKIDRLLLGGGGLLQDVTSKKSLLYYLAIAQLARLRGKPVYIFNQSLGPLSPSGESWVRHALRGAKVFLRDQGSRQYAQKLGIAAELGADPALLLKASPVDREPGMVVLVPKYGTEAANATLYALAQTLKRSGQEVLVLGLQPGFDEPALANFKGFTCEMVWDPRRVIYLMARASYVVSIRLHGAILAAAVGTPFAAIAYDPKVAGFCHDAGAMYLDLPGDAEILAKAILENTQPNWPAVEAMKQRAQNSFNQALMLKR